ncbi:MAG: hypothetical protein WC373_15905 [Smithella sp.]|jgi:hypothetical protein
MTEPQSKYGIIPEKRKPKPPMVQKWSTGYTAVVETEKKTYRLFNSDYDKLWIDIRDKINADNNKGKSI